MFGIAASAIIEHAILRAGTDYETPTIGDVSPVDGSFPTLFWLNDDYTIPALDGDTIQTILWPAFIAAAAGKSRLVIVSQKKNLYRS